MRFKKIPKINLNELWSISENPEDKTNGNIDFSVLPKEMEVFLNEFIKNDDDKISLEDEILKCLSFFKEHKKIEKFKLDPDLKQMRAEKTKVNIENFYNDFFIRRWGDWAFPVLCLMIISFVLLFPVSFCIIPSMISSYKECISEEFKEKRNMYLTIKMEDKELLHKVFWLMAIKRCMVSFPWKKEILSKKELLEHLNVAERVERLHKFTNKSDEMKLAFIQGFIEDEFEFHNF